MRSSIPATLLALVAFMLASCDPRPASEGGGSSDPTSGAHTIHLTGTLARGLACTDCHNSQFQVTFPLKPAPEVTLARANGAQPIFNTSNLTCSNVYCHAGGPQLLIGGGTVMVPTWNPPSVVACGGCHALPGGTIVTTSWHPAVAVGVQCALCHPGYTNSTVNREIHVNGVANLTQPTMKTSCAACHGDPTRVLPPGTPAVVIAAPPVDREGASSTTVPSVGAHQAHLLPGSNAISMPIACSECHDVPENLVHVGPVRDSPAKLHWGTLAGANQATPAYDRATNTCTNYCHGQTLVQGGGRILQPKWTEVDGTQAACGACHASPPVDASHSLHAEQSFLGLACSVCHPPGYAINAVGPDALQFHVNGAIDVNAANLPAWNANAVGPSGWTGTSVVGCHGGTRYWRPGSLPTSCG